MMTIKKTLAGFVAATLIALGFVGLTQTAASAAVTPFACESAFYQTSQASSKTQLYKLNVATSTYSTVGAQASIAMNGIGYNPQDNFIYGWVGAKLYQVDSTGVFTDTGVSVTGVNPSGADFIGPDIMILTNSSATVQKVVLTRTAGVLSGGTVSTLTTTGNTGTGYGGAKDIAIFKEGTHYMGYAAEGTSFFTFDFGTSNSPTNLTYVNRAVSWSPAVASSTFGAQYADASGNLYFYNNTSASVGGSNVNYVYYMSSATRTGSGSITSASVVTSNPISAPNDGASCVTAASPLAPTISATVTVSNVTTTGASTSGTITTNNSAVASGSLKLCYSTSPDVTGGLLSTSVTCVDASPASAAASSSPQNLTNTLTGLSSGTTYYVQYKATNAAGLTGWSNVANFTTSASGVTMTFNKNDGSGTTTTQSYVSGATNALSFSNPWTRTGYTFLGWSTSASATAADSSYTVSGAATLYAVWQLNSYTLTFDKNAGGASTTTTSSYSYGATNALSFSNPWTRNGYTFLGWSTSASATAADSSYTVTGAATLYAVWHANSYTVTFDKNDGGAPTTTTASYSYGATNALNHANTWTISGYTFLGWSTNPSATAADSSYTVTGAATLYAVWQQNPASSYTVTYDANDGSGYTQAEPLTSGDTTALNHPNPWTRNGYTFLGWSTSASATAADSSYTVTGSASLYAVWSLDSFKVTYDANDSSGNTHDVTLSFGDTNSLNFANPWTRSGYTFVGWSTSASATTADSSYTVTGSATLYAVWAQITHTVTFDKNDQSGTTHDATYAEGDTNALNFANPWTRNGYTFLGWSTDPNASTADVSFTVSADSTLYAIWSLDSFKVTYDANDNSGRSHDETLSFGDTNALNFANPWTRSGYTFVGWSLSDSATTADSALTVTGAGTLYAVWDQIIHTVTFDKNDQSGTTHDEVYAEGYAYALNFANPWTRAGYSFLGWSIDPNASDTDSSFMVSADSTLYAIWQVNLYNITYNSNDGLSNTDVQGMNYGVDYALQYGGPWTRDGYTLLGWSTDPNATVADTVFIVEGDADLYAVWSLNTQQVTYDANDGSGNTQDETVNYGDTNALNFSNPWTRSGYSFVGWSIDPNASNADVSFTVSSDATLYAIWHQNSAVNHRVTYHSADGQNRTTQVDFTDGATNALDYVNSWTRPGFNFVGWSASYGSADADTSYVVVADGDLFAIWAEADPATFGSFADRTKSITTHTYTLVAPTTNSGGAITYSLDCPGVATLLNNVVTFIGPGTCEITATVAAMPGFAEATVTMTLTITPEVKPIVVTPPSNGDPLVTDDGNGVSDLNLNYTKPQGKVTLESTDPNDPNNNWSLNLQGTDPKGTPTPLDEQKRLVFEDGNKVKTHGAGFKPGTKVIVCISGVQIGTVTTDANGAFNASFLIPQSVKKGVRYIQVNGVTNNNTVRSVSLAIIIKAGGKATLKKSIFFLGDSPKLTQKGGDILRAIRNAVKGKKNIVITVSGWVKETADKSYDIKLSYARAQNMVYVLKSIWHVKAKFSYKGYGISPENSPKSRRADIVVTFTK